MTMRTLLAAGAILAACAAASVAQARVFDVTPSSATASSASMGFDADFAIDGDKLTDWASNGDGTKAFLNLDLGGEFELVQAFVTDRVTSGGANGKFVGGLTDLTTTFSLQGFKDAGFTMAIAPAIEISRGAPPPGAGVREFRERVSMGGLTARYIQYKVVAARGPNTGLSEIYFVAFVPEPATWTLMIAGFGGVGLAKRRRRAPALVRV